MSLSSFSSTLVPLTASAKLISAAFDATADGAESNSPEWTPMMAALEAAKVQTCDTLVADLKSTAADAVTACQLG